MKHKIHLEEVIESITVTQDKIVMEVDTETLLELIEMLVKEVGNESL